MRNILFAFAVAAQVLTWCETRTWWRSAETMLLLAMWLPFSGTSYGIAGLLMLAVSHRLYRAEDRMERLALVACLLAVIPALNLATSDAAAVAGLVMTVLTVGLVSCTGNHYPVSGTGIFSDVLCLSSYCAGRSGCVTGMMLALILLINKQHNTGYL